MTQEIKTEVVKLGENMTEEERQKLGEVLAEVKSNADQEQEPEAAQTETPKEEAVASPCRVCGNDPGKEKQPPPEADVREFMRATLGGTRFSKTYPLMKGELEVTFETVDTKTAERMNKVITEFTAIDDITVFRVKVSKLQLIYMLRAYRLGDKEVKLEPSKAETPDEADKDFLERFGELDEQIIGMFSRVQNSFVNLKMALSDACFDENFYKGAGPF